MKGEKPTDICLRKTEADGGKIRVPQFTIQSLNTFTYLPTFIHLLNIDAKQAIVDERTKNRMNGGIHRYLSFTPIHSVIFILEDE